MSVYIISGLIKTPASSKASYLHGPTPAVSVLIAMRNEGFYIDDLINSLAKQIYPPESFELIIVDDQSDDWHFNKVKDRLLRSSLLHYKLLRNPGAGKKEALAYGVKCAANEMIVQTDGDVTVGPMWLWGMTRQLLNKHNGVVLGQVEMVSGKDLWSKYAALDFLSLQAATLGFVNKQNPIMANGANLSFMRETYFRFSKKHQKYASGDDVFLVQEAAKNNIDVKACVMPQAVVKTIAPFGLKAFVNQRVRWGAKTSGYPSCAAKITAVIVAFTNLIAVIGLPLSLIWTETISIYLMYMLIKFIVDFGVISFYATRFDQRHLLKHYPWVSILHPFISSYIIVLIVLRPNQMEWKQRKVPVVK